MKLRLLAATALAFTPVLNASAISVAIIFTDHAVLQQGMPVPVWGKADPNETVTVTYQDKTATATAGADGKWKATLPALPAKLSGDLAIKGASNTVTFHDVVTGEVWLCSGQSNMSFPVSKALNAPQEIAAANYPQIREFTIGVGAQPEPVEDAGGRWAVCSPQTAGNFYANAYFFGRDLSQALGVPVGLIASAKGGTIAEAWTSRTAIAANPKLDGILQKWDAAAPNYPALKARYEQDVAAWKTSVEAAKAAHSPVDFTKLPKLPPGAPYDRPAGLFNGMINPLIPYAIRGALWYQGESNAATASQYLDLCGTLIRDWRARWGEGNFPFLIMQLPRHLRAGIDTTGMTWAYLREAQTQLLQLPNVGLIVSLDLGDTRELHPTNKADFAKRSTLVALGMVYGHTEPWQYPVFKSATVDGNAIRVTFDHADGGLATRDQKAPAGFQIAGADQKFVQATARIDASAIVVSSPTVSAPKYVRYAFRNDPIEANLIGTTGSLTVAPFRTDTVPAPMP